MDTDKNVYFFGNKVADYGIKNGKVDYKTLYAAFDAVLCNDIIEETNYKVGEWELIQGDKDNSKEIERLREEYDDLDDKACDLVDEEKDDTEEYDVLLDKMKDIEYRIEDLECENGMLPDVFQYYIIDEDGFRILRDYTNDPIWYNQKLDLFVSGVTHCGTAWDYVLTDISLEDIAK